MTLEAFLAARGIDDAKFGQILNCDRSFASRVRRGERKVSAQRAVEVEREHGIPRWRLRPDLWEPPHSNPEAA